MQVPGYRFFDTLQLAEQAMMVLLMKFSHSSVNLKRARLDFSKSHLGVWPKQQMMLETLPWLMLAFYETVLPRSIRPFLMDCRPLRFRSDASRRGGLASVEGVLVVDVNCTKFATKKPHAQLLAAV